MNAKDEFKKEMLEMKKHWDSEEDELKWWEAALLMITLGTLSTIGILIALFLVGGI